MSRPVKFRSVAVGTPSRPFPLGLILAIILLVLAIVALATACSSIPNGMMLNGPRDHGEVEKPR